MKTKGTHMNRDSLVMKLFLTVAESCFKPKSFITVKLNTFKYITTHSPATRHKQLFFVLVY